MKRRVQDGVTGFLTRVVENFIFLSIFRKGCLCKTRGGKYKLVLDGLKQAIS